MSREDADDKLKAITDKLEQGVQEIFSSEKFKIFLDTMAKFPRYSVNNSILIMMQRPDASLVQSYSGWKKMGRNVKRGEKGIRIIAPTPYTIRKEQQKVDEHGSPVFSKSGEPVIETVDVKMTAFKVVSTFDVSQTEGKELPSIGVSELKGSVENFPQFMEAIKEVCPVPIGFEDIRTGAKGYYHTADKRIAIKQGMSELQTLKTALHEMTHQMLHADTGIEKTKSSKEIEAEATAYTVCKHYGLDTSDYSFSYVASWAGGKDLKELKASLDTIQHTAKEIISRIDEEMEKLDKYKEFSKTNDVAKAIVDSGEKKIIAESKPIGYVKIIPDEKPSVIAKLKQEAKKIKLTAANKTKDKEVVFNGR